MTDLLTILLVGIAIVVPSFYAYHFGWMKRHKLDITKVLDWEVEE